jgi:hypothetical protein
LQADLFPSHDLIATAMNQTSLEEFE